MRRLLSFYAKQRVARGLYRGELNGRSKLTEKKVQRMRILRATTRVSYSSLAARFNVSYMTVRRVITGEHWQGSAGPLTTGRWL